MGRGAIAAAGGVLVACLAVVAVALAAQPHAGRGESPTFKGTVYKGETSTGIALSFQVSTNGKLVLGYESGVVAPLCGPAPGPPEYPTRVKVSHGRFTVKEALPHGSKNGETITGRLLSGGRAKGKIKGTVECLSPPVFRSGPVKHYHASWSAVSEPDGKASRYCFDHVKPTGGGMGIDLTDIIMFHTTCKTVYAAMNAGTFSTVTPYPFTTPGWECTSGSEGLPKDSCKKGTAKFSFTKYD